MAELENYDTGVYSQIGEVVGIVGRGVYISAPEWDMVVGTSDDINSDNVSVGDVIVFDVSNPEDDEPRLSDGCIR